MISVVLASRLVVTLANIVSVVVLLRLLPIELYGEFAYAISLLLLAAQLARMGMQSIVVKRVIKSEVTSPYWVSSYFANHFLINTVLCVVTCFYLYVVNSSMTLLYVMLAMFGSVIRPAILIEPILQGRGLFNKLSEFSVVYALVGLLVKVVVAFLYPEYIYACMLIEVVIFLCYVYLRHREILVKSFNFRYLRFNGKLLYVALPFAVSGIFYLLNSRTDQVLVRHFGQPEDLSLYMLFIKLAEVSSVFSMSICSVVTTLALREFNETKRLFSATITYYKYNAVILLAGLLLAAITPKEWFVIALGNQYGSIFDTRYLLVLMYIMYALTQYMGVIVLARGLQNLAAYRSAACFFLNIPIYFFCYLYWGVEGLIGAVALANIVISLLFYVVTPKTRAVIFDLLLRRA
jgi:O-antigen/teichoic acid export membrane protein